AALAVPANRLAHPLTAAMTLLEVGPHLLHRGGQLLVARAAAVATAHPLRRPARLLRAFADGTAEEPTTHGGNAAAEPGHRMLERRRVSVAAALAIELELVSLLGRDIAVVVGERNHLAHNASSFALSDPGPTNALV